MWHYVHKRLKSVPRIRCWRSIGACDIIELKLSEKHEPGAHCYGCHRQSSTCRVNGDATPSVRSSPPAPVAKVSARDYNTCRWHVNSGVGVSSRRSITIAHHNSPMAVRRQCLDILRHFLVGSPSAQEGNRRMRENNSDRHCEGRVRPFQLGTSHPEGNRVPRR